MSVRRPEIVSRRQVLAGLGVTALAASAARPVLSATADIRLPASAAKLPRWRGFNLLEKFLRDHDRPFREWDFTFMANHGFDFVRLPLDYRIWTTESGDILEAPLRDIDLAIGYARSRGIHVTLCLHRAPGYCVNPPKEALDLWGDGEGGDEARRRFAAQWRMFAARYKTVPSTELSFDLVNEPPAISAEHYIRAASPAVAAIRQEDADRLIIADGRGYGRTPTPELVSLNIAQAGRGYEPFKLTHYRASWVEGSDRWAEPTWPFHQNWWGVIDRDTLWKQQIEPWRHLEAMGVGVIIGEWGAYRFTPHAVTLAWMKDSLENWKTAGWGWCLWNLRGDFGPLDSNRADVAYEDYDGSKLDRSMLELLRQY